MPTSLPARDRYVILISVFLGWMFAGVEMSLMVPATRPAIQDFLSATQRVAGTAISESKASAKAESPLTQKLSPLDGERDGKAPALHSLSNSPRSSQDQLKHFETSADQWLSWYIAAFLLGAAVGGAAFGWMADRAGRVKAMGWSIVCYSVVTGLSYFARTPQELLVLRFLACLGIGGMWPSGVALAAEAWPSASRPALAGLIGTAANVGFLALGIIMLYHPITKESWRWVLLLGGTPILLGWAVLWLVPESPRWLAGRDKALSSSTPPVAEVFHSPFLQRTLLGIALGTIPLLGGWASGQRLVPWAGQVGEQAGLPQLKALTQTLWAFGAVVGSLLGGWVASSLGRRQSYFLISLGSLVLSGYIFLTLTPTDREFLWATFALGLVSTSFFGWLPYYLPELFPTRIRATGAGVSYNFGRIFSAIAVWSSAALSGVFQGNIAKMGAATSLVYAAGLLIAWLIPANTESTEE